MSEFQYIKLGQISESELNPRKKFDPQQMTELADSVRSCGILQPILVRPIDPLGGELNYEVVCGARRYRAAVAVGLDEIPAVVRQLDEQTMMEIQVIENLQRADVHPLEEAEGYEKLIDIHHYLKVEDVAAKVGKSKAYVYGRMKLCELTEKNRQRFYDDKFTPSVALLVARVPEELQEQAGAMISGDAERDWEYGEYDGPMRYQDAKKYIEEQLMCKLESAPFDTKSEILNPGAGSCVNCPNRTGNDPLLFADIQRDDICTHPKCYQSKVEAFRVMVAQKAAESGKKLLSPKEQAKAFKYGRLSYDCGYIDVAEHQVFSSKDNKRVKASAILKKIDGIDDDVVYAISDDHQLVKLYPEKKFESVLIDLGHSKNEHSNSNFEAKQKELKKVREIMFKRICDDIIPRISADTEKTYVLPLLKCLLEFTSYDTQQKYCRYMDPVDWKKQGGDFVSKIAKGIDDVDEAMQLLARVQIFDCFSNYCDGGGRNIGVVAEKFCELYGIDIKQVQADVKRERRAAAKKKGTAKTTKKAVKRARSNAATQAGG